MAKKIRIWVATGFAGAKHEDEFDVPDDWEEMTKEEQAEYIEDGARDFRNEKIEYGGKVIEVDDDEEDDV